MRPIPAERLARSPLREWDADFGAWLRTPDWPGIDAFEQARLSATQRDGIARPAFVAQTRALLEDGLHYEERIQRGQLATRLGDWHDLFNAMAWLRWPRIKHALNKAQCADIASIGPRQRTRRQCAMTHFDEAGVIVLCSRADLVAHWDAHDWEGLLHTHSAAWSRDIHVEVFGHALLELSLAADRFLVGKVVVLQLGAGRLHALRADAVALRAQIDRILAGCIEAGRLLGDPQELRPLPLSGIPAWHPLTGTADFYRSAACFQPLRPGRVYPLPVPLDESDFVPE